MTARDRLALLQTRWAALPARERRLLVLGLTLVGLALLWWIALAPALRTLAAAPAEHARLDAQLQQMTTLQTQARALQAQPRASRDDALRALESSVRDVLGARAQLLTASGTDAASVTLHALPADTLTAWLAQARGNARAVPREAHLVRAPVTPSPSTAGAAPAGPAPVRWDGPLVMSLPAAP